MEELLREYSAYIAIERDVPRKTPGHDECTWKALRTLPCLSNIKSVLDIGYGGGQQTSILAHALPFAQLTALDLYAPSDTNLNERLTEQKLEGRVEIIQGDFDLRQFPDKSFDLLWCESSMATIGLEDALRLWKRVLRPDGHIAFIDYCWLSEMRPIEASEFWRANYPGMLSLDEMDECISNSGFHKANSFVLPEYAWWDEFLSPLEELLGSTEEDLTSDFDGSVYANERSQIEIFRRFGGSFGAVFSILEVQSH